MFSSTLSHMWDRLNLPMLLFKEGLLILPSDHKKDFHGGDILTFLLITIMMRNHLNTDGDYSLMLHSHLS